MIEPLETLALISCREKKKLEEKFANIFANIARSYKIAPSPMVSFSQH
jgi:hypothetical protein